MSALCRLTIVTSMPCVPTAMEVSTAPAILDMKATELRVQVGSYAKMLVTMLIFNTALVKKSQPKSGLRAFLEFATASKCPVL